MIESSALVENDILSYLEQHENKELLRFLTCGSVDDGKSTLIGRLLHDSKMIFEDHLSAIKNDSKKFNTTDEEFDLALLVDGLQSEREQGITIDVAYRYFTTDKRKFIIADTPGHEQYTRNMATGASNCDLAIVMVDARHGIMTQTKRHSFIVSLLGIKHVVVAINKMDLVDYSEERYNEIVAEYKDFAAQLDIPDIRFAPISALRGDNVVNPSEHTPWYTGETLMSTLETIEIAADRNMENFRLPVQYVIRPNLDFRGFAGTIASGSVKPGDEVVSLPSGKSSRVKSISTFDGELESAGAAEAVTLTLEDEIDVSRGDMLVKKGDLPCISQGVKAHVIWMAEAPLKLNKQYAIKFVSKKAVGNVVAIEHKIDVNTLETSAAEQLELNEIAVCDLSFDLPVIFDRYKENRISGAFIIIDRITNGTVGAGMIIDDLDVAGLDTGASSAELKSEVREKLEATIGQLDQFNDGQLIAILKTLKGL
ncbi:sulfate adenylyltransferase subunit CysN [Pseudomaricurvus alkylphenolicus]|jgi:sulfate adenylyltransferase subunit 1|uniref:sulfate adenylyltransferase subunit CysN n=1 Tax=Pseudomaricurvus alkylphenolicus TaxID=1306991 RepID=UPI0014230BEF|nr:sulfate adenylyltransferase subunit CysN [Pseudomaricurvus alkylphenolicus]NIB37952.1 sulfate adenylyltransferase subunit CysN [Pseudomaricurvus alkylphenolicus]